MVVHTVTSEQEDTKRHHFLFDAFLTVHHSIDFFPVTNLMHTSFILKQYICYIIILNMFRAVPCSSSGKILLLQPLVSSLSAVQYAGWERTAIRYKPA